MHWGKSRTTAAPGSAKGAYLIVADIEAARKLAAAGIPVSELFHLGANGPASGMDPERGTYRSLASLRDPDGNPWVLQEITTRLPGRIDAAATSFGDATTSRARRGARRRRTESTRSAPGRRRQLVGLVRGIHGGRSEWRETAALTA